MDSRSERVAWLPLRSLKRWDRNYRVGNTDAIVASIVRFGFNGTLRVWQDGVVIAGNHALISLEIIRANGGNAPSGVRVENDDWLIPCVDVTHLNRLEAQAFAIADNRTQELGQDDPERLSDLLSEVKGLDGELFSATGYNVRDLEKLLRESAKHHQQRSVPDPQISIADQLREKWGTCTGQIWEIGSHRLMCGDSTDLTAVARLLEGELADCCWTDPPYGVNYKGKTKDSLRIENDNAKGLAEFLQRSFAAINSALKPGAAIYIAHPAGKLSLIFGSAFEGQKWRLRQTLVWDKDSMVLGHSDYHYKHEPIYFGYKPGPGRQGRGAAGWYGDDSQVSVFSIARPKRSAEHPTQKPVELVTEMVRNSTPTDGLVFEPFGGSGSTFAACEVLKRRCYGVELDPKFAAVILERLTGMGLKANLLGAGSD